MKNKRKIGAILLNLLLVTGILAGQYEWLEPKSVIHIFFFPAFIISFTLFPLNYYLDKKTKE